MGENSHQISGKRGKAGRFVVLAHVDGTGPDKLLAGLRGRNAAVRVVRDTAQAMVEVAQFKAQVLIVHEPETICEIESLLSAVRLYHPAVICWRHQASAPGRRENLSPFACQLTPVSSPKFTPAPKSLSNDNAPVQGNGKAVGEELTNRSPSKHNVSEGLGNQQEKSSTSLFTQQQDTRNGEQPRHNGASVHTNGNGRPVDSKIDSTLDHLSSRKPSPQSNGHHEQNDLSNDKSLNRPSASASDGPIEIPSDRPVEDGRHSLGHRLAQPLDALDDLTAGPLLSAEEIELLRGPLDDSDYPDEGFFTPSVK